ncbi:MAG: phosphotransferase [Acidimicrobiia bacterium]|nr:phosphotransferase [Acidimicrobiia bacterium]
MKPWDALTEAGRHRRLRSLALAALEQFPVKPGRLRLVGGFTNVIYRVDSPTGPHALRVDLMQDHTDRDVEIEVAWLEALGTDTDLDVARPVRTRSGGQYAYAGAEGVPGARRCTLFEWIPGRPIADHLSPGVYHKLGVLSARLHQHGARFTPPARPMPWDQVFYWPDDVDPYVLDRPEHAHHITRANRRTLERAVEVATDAFERLPEGRAQIVHGDLHPWNVHQSRGRLYALDFEDVMWADPVQDLAITLFYERDRAEYAALRSSFEGGYRTVAPWPASYDGEIEHFMAARTLMFINFVLNLDDDPAGFFARAFPRLEAFLERWARPT